MYCEEFMYEGLPILWECSVSLSSNVLKDLIFCLGFSINHYRKVNVLEHSNKKNFDADCHSGFMVFETDIWATMLVIMSCGSFNSV